MSVVVFSGPSISPREAAAMFQGHDGVFCGPAHRGDLLAAMRTEPQPAVIALIDGAFLEVPGVTHKEILWALHRGVQVYGASSMGALRAVEMAPFGMKGVGRIYSWYACGKVVSDEEVALTYGPPELDYKPLTVPLVDLRATLFKAVRQSVLTTKMASVLLESAKRCYFAERSLNRLWTEARSGGLGKDTLEAFQAWAQRGWVEQKRKDAVRLLRELRGQLGARGTVVARRPHFDSTWYWERLSREVGGRSLTETVVTHGRNGRHGKERKE